MNDEAKEPKDLWQEAMGSAYRIARDIWQGMPYEMARSNGAGKRMIDELRTLLDRAEEALG